MFLRSLLQSVLFAALTAALSMGAALGAPVDLTILHTNDLHSHFRPEKTPLGLGGIARIATAAHALRKNHPNTLMLDAGDWAEGSIYFTEQAGSEALRMMDRIGYDAVLVGNHDWINGPDVLLESLENAAPRFSVLGTNLSADGYARKKDFHKRILPYAIKEVGGVKVALIGLATFEMIYDKFFSPIQIVDPFPLTRRLVKKLKKEADIIIVLSHNSVLMNENFLRAIPEIDLIIGGHDHRLLLEPVKVERKNAAPGYIVEAGSRGRYLGKLNLQVSPRSEQGAAPALRLVSAELLQMDRRIPEDPEALAQVERVEQQIENRFGPIFSDHLGESEMELGHDGMENAIGDFITDAYRDFTPVDLAIDQNRFIYGELHAGPIHSADVFNAHPGIYNPKTGKAWTLKILPMRGRTLLWLLNVLYSYAKVSQIGSISTSGMEIIFNPSLFRDGQTDETASSPDFGVRMLRFAADTKNSKETDSYGSIGFIRSVKIGGEPLNRDKVYQVAAGGGVVEALQFVNRFLPGAIPTEGMVDTGMETWRIVAQYVAKLQRLTSENVRIGGRIRSLEPDLGVSYDDVRWQPLHKTPFGTLANVQAVVRNYGATDYPGRSVLVRLYKNLNGAFYGSVPDLSDLGDPVQLGTIPAGGAKVVEWKNVLIPEDLSVHNVTITLEGAEHESNTSNNEVVRWFLSVDDTPTQLLLTQDQCASRSEQHSLVGFESLMPSEAKRECNSLYNPALDRLLPLPSDPVFPAEFQ